MMGGAKGIEPFVKTFQDGMMRVKYANVPVVSAASGIALGGGCELLLHSAKRVAAFETYIGLVEVGVGLVPAGGGLKEAALAAARAAEAAGSTNLLPFLTSRFQSAAMAKVSSSALDAQKLGYLQPTDTIVFNVHELLHVARNEVRALADAGYRAPMRPAGIPVAGRSGISTIKASLVNMRDGGFISQHDFTIASRIAEAVCGGDVEAGALVDEEWLLALERKAFVELLGTAKPRSASWACCSRQAGAQLIRATTENRSFIMTKQLQDAYIVAATRSPIGKAPKGSFKNLRPDDLLATVLKSAVAQVPDLDPKLIEDAIVGCAIPEAQQGLNVARIGALLAGLPNTVGGVTVNRFCASGLTAVAMAADRIRVGESDVMIAAGVESMSMVPMMGNSPSMSPDIFTRDENIGIAYGMGLTAERVAQQWKITRDAQDAFSLASHQKALAAQQAGEFKDEITPIEIIEKFPNLGTGAIDLKTRTLSLDEGPRADTSLEGLVKLRAVFANKGSVTAGNSSQTSDGSAR